MKKKIFTLAIIMLGLTTAVSAQTGRIWTGGSVGFETSKTKGSKSATSYNILPEAGYMMSDNLGLGVRLGYSHDEIVMGNAKEKYDGFTINPFVRYSFLKGDIGGLFVDGGAGYTYTKEKEADIKHNELEIGFRPGVAINVSDRVALTGHFGFIGYQYEKHDKVKTNTFALDFDLSQVRFGVNILF